MLGNATANRAGSRVLGAHLSEEGRLMPKRSIVRLDAPARARLHQLLVRGTAATRTLTHARILLKADQGPAGPGWPDGRMIAHRPPRGADSSQAGLAGAHDRLGAVGDLQLAEDIG